jgi:predicted DNA-binding transcriptional regulator YafY
MRTKRSPAAAAISKSVSLERASRLYQLVKLLASGPKTRTVLLRRLHIDIRTFYRDMEVFRECRIAVRLDDRKYLLDEKVEQAIARLPFPDPNLTLGEAVQLAKGRSPVHRKLAKLVKQIVR